MRSRKLTIDGTRYAPMTVWNGEYHYVRIRFLDTTRIASNRGNIHTIVQRAANFTAARRLSVKRALRGKWHSVEVGRRSLAKRLMFEIEPLIAQGIVEVELDGHLVEIADD
jgi:hypothetical protein